MCSVPHDFQLMHRRSDKSNKRIQRQKIAMLRFPHDIALLGCNKIELEDALNGINQILIEEIKMKINKNK